MEDKFLNFSPFYHEVHPVDDRGKAFLSKVCQKFLPEGGGWLMRDLSGQCLTIISKQALDDMEQQIAKIKALLKDLSPAEYFTAKLAADKLDRITSFRSPVTTDPQGRISLPAFLRSCAGIEDSVVVRICHDHLELWDKVRLNAYLDSQLDPESMIQSLGSLLAERPAIPTSSNDTF